MSTQIKMALPIPTESSDKGEGNRIKLVAIDEMSAETTPAIKYFRVQVESFCQGDISIARQM